MAGEDFLIHGKISGVLALERKEELQIAIEEQRRWKMGLARRAGRGSKYLMEINLVEISSGEHQACWLLFVKVASVMPS